VGTRAEPRSREEDADRIRLKLDIGLDAVLEAGRRRRRIPVRYFAPAKVNLALHVTGRREDGYHLLDSLVVFAGVGDWLEIREAPELRLPSPGRGPEVCPRTAATSCGARPRRSASMQARDRPGKTPAPRGRDRRRVGGCGGRAARSGGVVGRCPPGLDACWPSGRTRPSVRQRARAHAGDRRHTGPGAADPAPVARPD
jgi:hypothetical protein